MAYFCKKIAITLVKRLSKKGAIRWHIFFQKDCDNSGKKTIEERCNKVAYFLQKDFVNFGKKTIEERCNKVAYFFLAKRL